MKRYDVFDAKGQCAGNLRKRAAYEYARGRESLGHGPVRVVARSLLNRPLKRWWR